MCVTAPLGLLSVCFGIFTLQRSRPSGLLLFLERVVSILYRRDVSNCAVSKSCVRVCVCVCVCVCVYVCVCAVNKSCVCECRQ